jgi:hypothetical protein
MLQLSLPQNAAADVLAFLEARGIVLFTQDGVLQSEGPLTDSLLELIDNYHDDLLAWSLAEHPEQVVVRTDYGYQDQSSRPHPTCLKRGEEAMWLGEEPA